MFVSPIMRMKPADTSPKKWKIFFFKQAKQKTAGRKFRVAEENHVRILFDATEK